MQTLLLPLARPGVPPPSPSARDLHSPLPRRISKTNRFLSPRNFHSSLSHSSFPTFSSLPSLNLNRLARILPLTASFTDFASSTDGTVREKLAKVARRIEKTARYFKKLGTFGFWAQLICTVVAAVILSFSIVITGKITSPVTFYATAGGISAAFISVFWSFGYLRLSDRLRRTANDPSKAPPRADVVQGLKNGIIVNVLGMGAAILGMQATVGLLVAKALTSSVSQPYYQGVSPGYSPVLALDVFLVQASANTILSHFFGLVSNLELLRSVTLPAAQATPAARLA